MLTKLNKLVRDRRGLSTMEYSVLFVVIVVAAVVLWKTLGEKIANKVAEGTQQYNDNLNTTPRTE
jgi:Flp pilus assembly pilin Flp